MNIINYSYINWKIMGTWGSFAASGHMRFSWMTIEHFKERTHYLSLTALRDLYKNIVRGFSRGTIYQLSIEYHFTDDIAEERKERYVKIMNEYMEKYGILAQEV